MAFPVSTLDDYRERRSPAAAPAEPAPGVPARSGRATVCPTCDGEGRVPDFDAEFIADEVCPRCGGAGTIRTSGP